MFLRKKKKENLVNINLIIINNTVFHDIKAISLLSIKKY